MTSNPPRKTLLFILTSHSQLGDTGKPTGYYLPELAHPYAILSPHYNIRFATPKGKAPVDPASVEQYREDPVSAEFLANASVADALESTELLRDIRNDLDGVVGVFFPGGHGPVFDLANDEDSQSITRQVYEKGGVVGAVCHGPAALVNVKVKKDDNDDDKYLVDGLRVTGFSNEEEKIAGTTEVVPFLLETELIARGGHYHKAGKPWEAHVEGQGTQVLTGQNPASSGPLAEAYLKELQGPKRQ